jgi:hypothetical protein
MYRAFVLQYSIKVIITRNQDHYYLHPFITAENFIANLNASTQQKQ